MAVAIALNLALVLLEGYFGYLAIATFSFAYSLVEWPWELLAAGATAAVAGLAQSSGFGLDPIGLAERPRVVAINIVIMCGLSWGLLMARRQEERAATNAERARLAREIHDTLAQRFTGIVGMVASAPDIDVVGEASDGAEATALARVLEPDVVLMDLRMPGTDGVTATREFARLGMKSRVVVLTTLDSESDVLPAILAGATGYLLKDAPCGDLLHIYAKRKVGYPAIPCSTASTA